MKALTPGIYGIIHSIEVSEEQLAVLADKLGIEKASRLKAGTILIIREAAPDEMLHEPHHEPHHKPPAGTDG